MQFPGGLKSEGIRRTGPSSVAECVSGDIWKKERSSRVSLCIQRESWIVGVGC